MSSRFGTVPYYVLGYASSGRIAQILQFVRPLTDNVQALEPEVVVEICLAPAFEQIPALQEMLNIIMREGYIVTSRNVIITNQENLSLLSALQIRASHNSANAKFYDTPSSLLFAMLEYLSKGAYTLKN